MPLIIARGIVAANAGSLSVISTAPVKLTCSQTHTFSWQPTHASPTQNNGPNNAFPAVGVNAQYRFVNFINNYNAGANISLSGTFTTPNNTVNSVQLLTV